MRFDEAVKPGGYKWWYVDAIADDGEHALTMIAFIGSVFSPYYAWANGKAPADAENYCAMNVALYGRHKAWAMTERSKRFLLRRELELRIGPSALRWDNGTLHADIDEVTVPWPRRLRGNFALRTSRQQNPFFNLDNAGLHRWCPISPSSRIDVTFETPKMSWSGLAYFDTNEGGRPLQDDFTSWHWSRSGEPDAVSVFYDVKRRDGSELGLAIKAGPAGVAPSALTPPLAALPSGFWGVKRAVRSDAGFTPRVITTFEDAPFYLRSHVKTRIDGVEQEAVQESLDLDRFSAPIVKLMLPFRMPRTR